MAIFLPDHREYLINLSERQRSFVIGNLLLYIFRGCQQTDIREALNSKKLDFDFLGWRRHLHHNGLLLRDGKLHVYAKAAKRELKRSSLGLDEEDFEFLDLGLRYRPLAAHLRELRADPFCRVLTVRQFDRFVGTVLSSEDLVSYSRKFIHKKMSFLMNSYGMEMEDLENILKYHALYGLQRAFPRFEHIGHGVAIAKTLVKRGGINLIHEMTTQKQNQLIHNKEKNTYSRTTVSLDGIADGTGQFLTADGTFVHRSLLVVGLGGANTFDKLSWDTLHSLRELCNSNRLKSKQRQFLNLMIGNYSEAFSDFLGRGNDDLLEEISYTNYMNKVCSFLSIPQEAATQFLCNLQPELGGSLDHHIAD